MLQHILLPKYLPKKTPRLLNDVDVGNNADDSFVPLGFRMAKRKCKGGSCFSAAGGDCQGKQPRLFSLSPLDALLQNGAAILI